MYITCIHKKYDYPALLGEHKQSPSDYNLSTSRTSYSTATPHNIVLLPSTNIMRTELRAHEITI
jgi:hypothetical protein